jgi:MFS family permease
MRHIVIASFGFGLAMLALAAVPDLLAAFPVALLVGLASVAFITTATAIVQVRADPSMRGRVLALQAMVMIGSTPIGGPIMGAVCDAFGARAALVLGGLATLIAAAYGRAATRRATTMASDGAPAGVVGTAEPGLVAVEAV